MSRLLFAAARGARIQYYDNVLYEWTVAVNVRLVPSIVAYRIHPDDEYLQYGSISTALRDFAFYGEADHTVSALMASTMYRYEMDYPLILKSEWIHAATFALLLSEELADRGM